MPYYLLTGAGFSRNWGGWLVNEAFEYLLGSSGVDDRIRKILWRAKERKQRFEDVLAALQAQATSHPSAEAKQDLLSLTNAISMTFAEMAAGYDRVQFDFQNDISVMVKTFLEHFDAIYTLNQDTLLEQKYVWRAVQRRACLVRGEGGLPTRFRAQGKRTLSGVHHV